MSNLLLPPGTVASYTRMSPLEQAVLGYLGTVKSPTTLRLYKYALNDFILWCHNEDLDPMTVVRGQVEQYLRQLEHGSYQRPDGTWKAYSESTISIKWGVVRSFYRYSVDERIITWDPTTRIASPTVDVTKQRCTFLPPVEFAALLKTAAAGKPMEAALLALIGLRGLRISEACGLDISNLDEVQGHRVIKYIGKGGKAHRHVLPVAAMNSITTAIGDREVGPILLNNRGNRMTRKNADLMLKRLAAAAGVNTDISPHSCRRSLITAALIMGEDLYDVQRMVGHSQPATTARYDRLKDDVNRDKVHNVSGWLTSIAG
jgi:integrase/recombinase XerD